VFHAGPYASASSVAWYNNRRLHSTLDRLTRVECGDRAEDHVRRTLA
jgi:hypothetical protein